MTYLQWLRRYVEYIGKATDRRHRWAARGYLRDRF